MNCQMNSTGLSSGDFDGSGSKVMLFGVSRVFEELCPNLVFDDLKRSGVSG